MTIWLILQSGLAYGRDKNYTYRADGTNETNKETTVPWPSVEGHTISCGVLEETFYSVRCTGKIYALCEKPVCVN